jgi:glycine/D-amino acid oxidase-like deaminating enzyme
MSEHKSIWNNALNTLRFEKLDGDIRCDVLVVGGGMAGLLCAYMLTASGADCVLAEAKRICGGITNGTTAKITSQHGLIYHKLIKRFGEDGARAYFSANESALDEYRKLCHGIDCDFEEKDNYIYSLDDRELLDNELSALRRIGANADYVRDLPLPIRTVGAVRLKNQAQFHPLKFAYGIATSGLRIYENTKVRELMPGVALTDGGKIRAKNIIIATHFPVLNKHGMYYMKLHQSRSYALGLLETGVADEGFGMYLDGSGKGLSWRKQGDVLIFGGGGHRTGERGGGWSQLESEAKRYYPRAKIEYRWAAQDCMSLDGVPYIGEYSSKTEGLFVATGFNKWGMSSSMVAARVLSDKVLGKKNPLSSVFSPSRSMLHTSLVVNLAKTLVNFITPTSPRCPHLGCALKYNKEEHSWDCPCHGSRFTEDMQLIDNPATDDKR